MLSSSLPHLMAQQNPIASKPNATIKHRTQLLRLPPSRHQLTRRFLQLSSNAIIPAHNITSHTRNTIHDWPPKPTRLHIEGNLYLYITRYNSTIEPSLEPRLLEALDTIVFDLETGGAPDGKFHWRLYQWHTGPNLSFWEPSSSTREPIWWTRSQAADVMGQALYSHHERAKAFEDDDCNYNYGQAVCCAEPYLWALATSAFA